MTNFKKGLSFSVFAVLAVAFCLLIGQAFAADLPSKAQLQQERNSGKLETARPGAVSSTQSAPDVPVAVNPDDAIIRDRAPKEPKPDLNITPPASVNTRTGGEDISTATVIGSLPYTDDGSTTGAADDYDGSCGNVSTAPDVVYQFSPVSDINIAIDLFGSTYDTKVFVFQDDASTEVACNDDFYPNYVSKISSVLLPGGHDYFIVIDGYSGADFGDYHLEVIEYDPLVCVAGETPEGETCGDQINAFGSDQVITSGETICGVNFTDGGLRETDYFLYTVPAGGQMITAEAFCDAGFPGYMLIWNAAGDDYLGPFYFGDDVDDYIGVETYLPAGDWHFNIRGDNAETGFPCGSNPAPLSGGDWRYKLTVTGRAPIPTDDCVLAATITEGDNAFSLVGMTPGINGYGSGENAFYEFSPATSGIAQITVTIDQTIDGYFYCNYLDGCEGGQLTVAGNIFGGSYGNYPFYMESPGLVGNSYILELGKYFGGGTLFTGNINVVMAPLPELTNDVCLNGPVDLGSGDTGDVFFHNVGATWTYLPDDYYDQGALGTDVWFTWTATVSGDVLFSSCDSDPGFDSRAELYAGGDCLDTDPRQPIAGDDDGCGVGGGMSTFWFTASAGQTYLLRIGGWYRDPDYLPPSQGVGYLSFTEGVTLTHPANDFCVDAVPFVLSAGVEVTETGSQTGMSNNDCLILDATTWHAFTPDTCMDLEVNYDGTFENFNWLIDDYMLDACPCYGANIVLGVQAYYPDPDAAQPGNYSHSATYYDLLPKTYWYPVYTGVEDYVADDYVINFIGTAKECDYCAASANPDVCSFGFEYLDGISVAGFANLGNGCNGYQDFKALGPISLFRGVPTLMTIDLADAYDTDTVGVWVDWNQNFDLSVAYDHVATTSDGNGGEGPWFATLTPPLDASLPGEGTSGYTLMRVRLNDGAVDDPVPCGVNVYGEVEDYTVEVVDWVCGDADGDGTFDGADVTFLVDMYFSGGPVPVPWQAGDANGDGFVNIADIVYLAEALNGGAAPVCLP